MDSCTRRDFLRAGLLGAAAFGLGGVGSALSPRRAGADEPPPLVRVVQVTAPGLLAQGEPDPGRLLAMVDRGLREALGVASAAAAWALFIRPTDRVGLKLDTAGPGAATHRALALAVAESLRQTGLPEDQIVVWDRAAADLAAAGWTLRDEPGALRVLACEQQGYDDLESFESDPPGEEGSRRSRFSRVLTQRTNRLVNLPALGYRPQIGLAGALTNITLGACDNSARGTQEGGAVFVPHAYAQPAVQRRVTLAIVDALRPWCGAVEDSRWEAESLLFTVGQVSADAVGRALVDQRRRELGLPRLAETAEAPAYLEATAEAGLGVAELDQIQWVKLQA